MESSNLEFYRNSINYILSVQKKDGSIPWELDEKLDPWDHIEAAMGLSIGRKQQEAKKAFLWLKDNQLPDGSWYAEYVDSIPVTKRRETNFSAYIATGLWHYYLVFEDKDFIENMLPTLSKALDFVLSMQTKDGDIYWASEEDKQLLDDSLITGSSSIYKSLECAASIFNLFGKSLESRKREENCREIMLGIGFQEVVTLTLTSKKMLNEYTQRESENETEVANPVTEDYHLLRSSILPNLLELLKNNKHRELPQRVFEIGQIVKMHTNLQSLAWMQIASKNTFSQARTISDSIALRLRISGETKECDDPIFIPGRSIETRNGNILLKYGEIQ